MTLIATFSPEGFPIVFGDLLVTGPNTNTKAVAVPAQGDVQDFFGDSGWSISGLTQKVNLIDQNCAIAWAGSWLGARIAIGGLKKLSAEGPLTSDSILGYLRADPELGAHPTSFVGLVHEKGSLSRFRFNAEEAISPLLGTVYLTGSGTGAMYELAKLLEEAETRPSGTTNAAARAISLASQLSGMLLQSELRGGDSTQTLRNMFGGGYEIAFFSGGVMQKLKEITYVLWEALLTPDGVHLSHPQLFVKQQYWGEHLLIRSARVGAPGDDGVPKVVDEQHHIIAPMYEAKLDREALDLTKISLQSPFLSHCVFVRNTERALGVYTRLDYAGPQSVAGTMIEDRDGQIVFSFRNDVVSEIMKSLDHFR